MTHPYLLGIGVSLILLACAEPGEENRDETTHSASAQGKSRAEQPTGLVVEVTGDDVESMTLRGQTPVLDVYGETRTRVSHVNVSGSVAGEASLGLLLELPHQSAEVVHLSGSYSLTESSDSQITLFTKQNIRYRSVDGVVQLELKDGKLKGGFDATLKNLESGESFILEGTISGDSYSTRCWVPDTNTTEGVGTADGLPPPMKLEGSDRSLCSSLRVQ